MRTDSLCLDQTNLNWQPMKRDISTDSQWSGIWAPTVPGRPMPNKERVFIDADRHIAVFNTAWRNNVQFKNRTSKVPSMNRHKTSYQMCEPLSKYVNTEGHAHRTCRSSSLFISRNTLSLFTTTRWWPFGKFKCCLFNVSVATFSLIGATVQVWSQHRKSFTSTTWRWKSLKTLRVSKALHKTYQQWMSDVCSCTIVCPTSNIETECLQRATRLRGMCFPVK